jgi:hypothetical protein
VQENGMTYDHDTKNDRSARRVILIVLIALVAAIAFSIYVLIDRSEPPTPGGDLATIPAAGGSQQPQP